MTIRLIISTALVLFATTAFAQRPKLDLKAYGGYHTHIFVYKDGNGTKDVLHGWQAGAGLRVTRRKLMGEIGFLWIRNNILLSLPDSVAGAFSEVDKFELHSFEIPLKAGYIPVKTAFFKWYVFTGIGLRFNTRMIIDIEDEEFKFKPKEVGLNWFNIDYILGTQFDVGVFNLEVFYNLGVNNSSRDGFRTNSHEFHFNIGFWF